MRSTRNLQSPPSPRSASAALQNGLAVVLLASVLFGIMAVCVQLAAAEMPAGQIAFFRFAGSLAVLLVLNGFGSLRPRQSKLGPLVLRGVIGSVAILLYFVGIQGAGAGLATLLQNAYPVFASIFAAVVLGEPFPPRLGIALVLDLVGIAFVISPSLRVDSAATLGALAACSAAVLSGGAVVAARHLRRTESASLITTYFMAVGALVTAPALLTRLPHPATPLVAALGGVILTSVAGQWLLHHGLGLLTAAQGSVVAATSVLTATGLQSMFLGQSPSVKMLLGGLLMVVAIGLTARAQPTMMARARLPGS